MQEIEGFTRQVWDRKTTTVDAAKRRVTYIKSNSRVFLPGPMKPVKKEELHIRKQIYMEELQKYLEEIGENQPRINMSTQEKEGLAKLCKRVKNKDLIICSSVLP